MDSNKRARPARAAQINAVTQLHQAFQPQPLYQPSTGAISSSGTSTPPTSSMPFVASTLAPQIPAGNPIPVASTNGNSTAPIPAATVGRGKRSASEEVALMTADERISSMRRSAPIIYDSILHHNLDWGSLSVCWGGEASGAGRILVSENSTTLPEQYNTEQTIYFAGRTDGTYDSAARVWTGSPGELFVGHVAIAKPRTVARNSIGKFQENKRSSRIAVSKRIIHPGEVNRIRALPSAPHLIATHTDSPTVYVWNTLTQPHRTENMTFDDGKGSSSGGASGANGPANTGGKKKNAGWSEPCKCSVPDFELIGHSSPAEYALDTKGADRVLSGGSDEKVLLWSLQDSSTGTSRIEPLCKFEGHTATVEDCSFKPLEGSGDLCCSVGQDRTLFLWDTRTGKYSEKRQNIHSADANCCAWSTKDYILTGGSDSVVNVFDIRKLDTPVTSITQKASVINVRWSPDDSNVFVTTDEDANLTIYKLDQATKKANTIFQHMGHRTSVVDVQFNPVQPWVLASVSDDSQDEARGGGGTLQIWRVSEFVYKSLGDREWATELEQAFLKSTSSRPNAASEEESGDEA